MTARITQSMLTQSMLSDLNRIEDKLQKTHEQMSTGKQLNRPSDDPYAVGRAVQLQTELASNKQYQQNVQDAQSWQTATSTALMNIGSDVLSARNLVVQGATGTMNQSDLNAIASQVNQLIDSIKTSANTQYQGQYVFSGTLTTTAPYTLGATDTYNGNAVTTQREIGPGIQVTLNTIGQNVIGDGTTGLIQSLRQIATDLTSGNTAALQSTDLQALDTASDTITSAQAAAGASQNRLQSALSRLQQGEQLTTQVLSNTEDADMAQVMVDASQESAVLQAALQSGATIIQPSLLDFLH